MKNNPLCPYCNSANVVARGWSDYGHKYNCRSCLKFFTTSEERPTPKDRPPRRNRAEQAKEWREKNRDRIVATRIKARDRRRDWIKNLTEPVAIEIKAEADKGANHKAIAKAKGIPTNAIGSTLSWIKRRRGLDTPQPVTVPVTAPPASKKKKFTTVHGAFTDRRAESP